MVHTLTSSVKDLVYGRNMKFCVTAVRWSVGSEGGEDRLELSPWEDSSADETFGTCTNAF